MTECHTQIHETNPWVYKLPREGEFFLMGIILRSNLPQTDQEIFNRVRLNMKLLTASDIVCADSRSTILPNIFNGKNYRSSSYNWPTTQCLPKNGNRYLAPVFQLKTYTDDEGSSVKWPHIF